MGSDKETEGARYYGEEHGVVTMNADPLMIGRVKIRIPGIIAETEWALPHGGGGKQRGRWQIPKVGARVNVWFHRGDPHGNCWYQPSNWANAKGGSEAPTFISADPTVTPETAPLLTGIEDDRYYMVIDARPGKQAARIVDKVSGDKVELDGRFRACNINVTGAVTVTCGEFAVNGARILFNGRAVVPFGGPIG
jgi:Type VI secretion system/phage-baseplate injector OB domain